MNKFPPKLHVGRLPFLVCAPFFHGFLDQNTPKLDWIDAPPAQLNGLLAQGKIHAAPSSSLEYLSHWQQYHILPDYCTGSTLEIRSVKLFSKRPLEALHGKPIYLTTQSATSVALLKILLRHQGIEPQYVTIPEKCEAKLLIGDQALLESKHSPWPFEYDLASLWQDQYHLPFVFGLWIVHDQVLADPILKETLQEFRLELKKSMQSFYQKPAESLIQWLKHYPVNLEMSDLLQYYQAVDYQFSKAHQESLKLFAILCFENGLIAQIPELNFLDALLKS